MMSKAENSAVAIIAQPVNVLRNEFCMLKSIFAWVFSSQKLKINLILSHGLDLFAFHFLIFD